jgi:predicted nucleic acid-binding protein
MRTALDSNILSLLWSAHPDSAAVTTQLAEVQGQGGVVVCGAVFVELCAHPKLSINFVKKFLAEMTIAVDFELGEDIWQLAAERFAAYAVRRRRSGGGLPKRLLVDFIVASHAQLKADRLMTRDAKRYKQNFPTLHLI